MAHPKILLHVITNHVSFIVLDARKYVYPGGGAPTPSLGIDRENDPESSGGD